MYEGSSSWKPTSSIMSNHCIQFSRASQTR